ncbi:hypothetical protein Poly24_43480 [Rosistilla carotiformis]|uniref:Uncharacterized protein n=1 Tax=Rosistilla carotiformis TaxID=2528017 RepID=A0A518JYL1_9BACT|nr:hypothetical protein [Rosistilla carotiformis]QDV70622.1 hypothetical protein Poly24_43480 [Rosistilla carotiformis]
MTHAANQSPQPTTQFALDRLEKALAIAKRLGFIVRSEWLGGSATGWCEMGGKRILFVDLSLSVHEQLEQVEAAIEALRAERNKPA